MTISIISTEKIIKTVEIQLFSGMTTFNIIEIEDICTEKIMVKDYMDGGQPYKRPNLITSTHNYYKLVNSVTGHISRWFETKEEMEDYLR
tara:strand:+ start:569 stop:838 length:270 start_codon:yes stop_codon:yes gene_type:complete